MWQGVFGEDGGFKVPELPSSALGSSTVRSVAADLPRLAAHPGIPLTSAATATTTATSSTGVASSSGAAAIPSATSVRIPVGVGLNKSKGLVQPGIPGTNLGATAANPNTAAGTKPTTTPAGKDKNASAIEEEYEDDDEFIDEPYGGYSEYYEEDYS